MDTEIHELGNRVRVKYREYYIDVFAKNKNQRDEFGYKILNELENGIPVYNYDEGFPPAASPSQVGALIPDRIQMQVHKILPELVDTLYYRSTISFSAVLDKLV